VLYISDPLSIQTVFS